MTLYPRSSNTNGIFYQPLNRDASVTSLEWRNLLQQTANSYDGNAIVVQWNQYGEEKFGGQTGWFAENLATFQKEGFALWLGLYSDPHYYTSIHTEQPQQDEYLTRYFVKLVENYQAWQPWIRKNNALGVYIPAELSDYDFDTPMKRKTLNRHLTELKNNIHEPMMISVYLSGNITPEETLQWLTSIENTGIKVMVQDGRGTQLLNDSDWGEYKKNFSCEMTIIKEIFIQENHNIFNAKRMSEENFLSLVKDRGCHDIFLFSLRYVPFELNPLPLQDDIR